MHVRCIREVSSGQIDFFQSRTQLNTPGLGTLMPEAYRETAEATNQADELFILEVLQGIDISLRLKERDFFFQWISVYMPPRVLSNYRTEKRIMEVLEKTEFPSSKLCFALPESLLDVAEPDKKIIENIKKLRNRGFHFMLEGFGSENCPLMRLSSYEVDYCLLHHDITRYLGKGPREDKAVNSIISFVNELNAEAIADGVKNSKQAEQLYECGCSHVAGSLAGRYMNPRYIRNPQEEESEN
ncbi:MAG: EAL domain-containing protein [Lachnospiraceae bacterium]|nr:EAL domain-containing protein [Lachnospiraceae bacterium]